MTRLCLISDTHGTYRALTLPSADVLVHAGDWCYHNTWQEVKDFLDWLESQPHAHKVLIPGNHDWVTEREPETFARVLVKYAPSVTYLHDSGAEIEELKFWGSGVSPRFMEWAWNRDRGPDIQRHWDLIPTDTDVLVTHGPPMGILDNVVDFTDPTRKIHVGCANLRTTIMERLKGLKLHVFGHLHAPGGSVDVRDGVTYVNASVVNESYVLANQPIIITL